MTTIESYKKFGLETRSFVGGILMAVGCAFALLGLAVVIVDQNSGAFGLEGAVLIVFLLVFIGLGLGFRVLIENDLWKVGIPLLIIVFLFSYLGIMYGRRKKEVRARRWMLLGVLFLLILAVKGAFFS